MSSLENDLANSQAIADLASSVSNILPTPSIIPESSSSSQSSILPIPSLIPGSDPNYLLSSLPIPPLIPGNNPSFLSGSLPTPPLIPGNNLNTLLSGLPTPPLIPSNVLGSLPIIPPTPPNIPPGGNLNTDFVFSNNLTTLKEQALRFSLIQTKLMAKISSLESSDNELRCVLRPEGGMSFVSSRTGIVSSTFLLGDQVSDASSAGVNVNSSTSFNRPAPFSSNLNQRCDFWAPVPDIQIDNLSLVSIKAEMVLLKDQLEVLSRKRKLEEEVSGSSLCYSIDFMNSLSAYDVLPFLKSSLPGASGPIGHSVVNADGKIFSNVVYKLDNNLASQSDVSLFINRIMLAERLRKFTSLNGVIIDDKLLSVFVEAALRQNISNIEIDANFKTLSGLVLFREAQIFLKDSSGSYLLFQQFVRGEFSPYSLFKADAPTDLNAPLNVFSLMGRPYPTSYLQIDMLKCVSVVKLWEKFFEVFCSAPKSCNLVWSAVFADFLHKLEYDLILVDPLFLLDSFNNVLCDWFQLCKNHFSFQGIKYAFKEHISAMLLLKDLLSRISANFVAISNYNTRKNLGLALICFEKIAAPFKGKPLSVLENTSVLQSSQICFHHICSNLLSLETPFGYYCKGVNCKYLHPDLSDLPALKDTLSTYLSNNKKIPDKFKLDIFEQIDKISGGGVP